MAVHGELEERVDPRGRLTLPFIALIRRPDASVLVHRDAELDWAFMPEETGETDDTVILRGIQDESAVPRGSVITASRPPF